MTKLKFTKDRKEFYAIVAVVFLAVAIPVTIFALLTNRDQRGRAAGSATISLSPASQTINQNTNFTVSIFENSGTEQVSGVQANLSYDVTKLDFVSIDNTGSLFGDLGSSLPDSISGGVIKMTRIIPGGNPPVTGNQLVTKVTFKTKTVLGATAVNFAAGTTIGRTDSTDILGTSNGGNYTVQDPPPTVSLTAPTDGAKVKGNSVTVSANASDDLGVSKVEFYDGATIIGTPDTTSPYSVTWNTTGLTNGNHSLTAKAFDATASKTSTAVTVMVDNLPPSVSITSPTNGATISGSAVNVTATSSDANAGVEKVEFFVDGASTPKATDTSSPYSFSWNTTSETNTSHTLTAKSTDLAGNTNTHTINVTIDNLPPSAPTNLQLTAASTTQINLTWTASTDTQSGVASYDVFRNGTKINASPVTATSYNDTGLTANTTYSYHVVAKDNAGNTSAASTTVSGETQSLADLNNDAKVNVLDLIYVTQRWLTTNSVADLNNDGIVNVLDLIYITSRWAP